MHRPILLIWLLVTALFNLNVTGQRKKLNVKPNVIIINMDDMGYGDVEPYGATGVKTPNFNLLAKRSILCSNFIAAQAVCSPSRAAMLTGCYPNRLGINGPIMPWQDMALHASEKTIATILKDNGYKAALIGKWHLGNDLNHSPNRFGFDLFYGLTYSNDMWPFDHYGNRIIDSTDFRYRYPALLFYENSTVIDTIQRISQQEQLTTRLTDKAIDFIKRNKSTPFFLYLAHPMPHTPLAVSEKFKGRSESGLYNDVMMELDWSLGEIIRVLDNEMLTSNTIVIVTSDNGPWKSYGTHGGSSGGFREGKQTIWEGGVRVPMLISYPGNITPGYYSGLFTNLDLLPTIMSLCNLNIKLPAIDGIDFSSVLLGKTTVDPRTVFYYYFDKNCLKAVRYKNWKLVLPHVSNYFGNSYAVNGNAGSIETRQIDTALYNLTNDPGERIDVKNFHPDILLKLFKIAEEAREDLGDDLMNRPGKNRRTYLK